MAANSTSPHGLCSPQCPPEPKYGCCTHAFPAPLLLLTLLTGLLSSSSGNPRQVPPPFLPWGDSSPCLTNNPGIYLRKAQGPWTKRRQCQCWPCCLAQFPTTNTLGSASKPQGSTGRWTWLCSKWPLKGWTKQKGEVKEASPKKMIVNPSYSGLVWCFSFSQRRQKYGTLPGMPVLNKTPYFWGSGGERH